MRNATNRNLRIGWTVVCVAIVTCCSKSPTAPASSTTPSTTISVLTLSGPTLLTPGLTSQLAVTTSLGAAVTTGLTWQSTAPTVATVSATGLVMAIGAGAATITATASGAAGRASIVVQQAGSGTTTLSACTTIATPGHYVLNGDVAPSSGPCLTLSDVAGVQLDCQGHAISGLFLSNANAVTISNCSLTGGAAGASTYDAIGMNHVYAVKVTGCTVLGGVAGAIIVTVGADVEFIQDTITSKAAGSGEAILLQNGSNNQVLQTMITGGYDGSQANVGTDDGILLENEVGDTIEGNTISTVFDLGVEGVASVANTTIANNTFFNIGTGGVGSYWCTSWTSDVISGNNVTTTPTLTFFGYQVGPLCGPTQLPANLSGNQFISNVFRNPSQGVFLGPMTLARMEVSMPGGVTGNLVQNNDFGTNDGPSLVPLSGFIDGGGNICGPLNPGISNFVCTGGGFNLSFAVTAFRHPLSR